ncbi:hypothetical protein DM02DRAFT_240556 [Periconia macrospinosa]|uniref:Uncharacterized protein n=1 Tax=Periconia macrospinosa TaxID=97972 RepID=A0A2V1DZX1_9PLEO|nr:hypothetical protein DM02DRAFT_240556 [Periconia macrospinosa]
MTTSPINPTHLLHLPLELRDQIYTHAVSLPTPIPLYAHHASHLPSLLTTHAQLESEALRIYYAVNTFTLSLLSPPTTPITTTTSSSSSVLDPGGEPSDDDFYDYAHDWTHGRLAPLRPYITTLEVSTNESFSPLDNPYSRSYEDDVAGDAGGAGGARRRTCTHDDRRKWTQLLLLPRLAHLTIKLQKRHQTTLFMRDLGPVVYALRARQRERLGRDVTLELKISFDVMLRAAFEDPIWTTLGQNAVGGEAPAYKEMGYVDASELLEEASAEDEAYVKEFLGTGEGAVRMPRPPPTMLGLLSESVGNRRVLALHYAVREPGVMRVIMGLWYKVYLEVEAEKEREGKAAEGV